MTRPGKIPSQAGFEPRIRRTPLPLGQRGGRKKRMQMTIKAPTTARRQIHPSACTRLAPAIFLSPPLPSLWDGAGSPGVRCDHNPMVKLKYADSSVDSRYRLVGLMVRRQPRERKIPGSNPACAGIFSGSIHTYQWLKNWHSSGYSARRLSL